MNLYSYGNKSQCQLNKQEDALYIGEIENFYVFVVADGNGGQPGKINIGQLAVNIIINYLQKVIHPSTSSKEVLDSLNLGLYIVSQAFLAINAIDNAYESIYASMSVLIVDKDTHQTVYASIGNTEIQMIRNSQFRRINRVFNETYDALLKGEIEEKDFYIHPRRAVLTSALGIFENPTSDIMSIGTLQEGDILFLTTDGIYRYITPDQVIEILAEAETIEDGVNQVLKEVNEKGGEDNATLVVINTY